MAGKRITSLNTLTGANTATIDVLPIVDVSAGEAKQITTQELSNALVTINGGLQGGFGVYTNTTLGLANTANGGYFFVPSANTGESLSMYQDVGGTAVYITGIPEFNTTENPYGGLSRQSAADIKSIFIYDTTQDSDGGEWRKKCQHTSWYREMLDTSVRGSRRKFPKLALIVVTGGIGDDVVVFDLDSGVPAMWRVFPAALSTSFPVYANGTNSVISCVSAQNGVIAVGSNGSAGGLNILDLILDRTDYLTNAVWYARGGPLAGSSFPLTISSLPVLVNRVVNSVTMRVMPGTPRNPQRLGLPDPTIVVGTDGGVSIIHPDGNVADITFTSNGNTRSVAFRPSDGALCIAVDSNTPLTSSGRHRRVYHQLPTSDIAEGHGYVKGSADEFYPMYPHTAHTGTSFALGADATNYSRGFNGLYDVGYLQLVSFLPEPSKPESGARAVLTPTYNTGYMVGDVKLALAESTADVTSLVGNTILSDDFSGYADTAALLAAGWTLGGNGSITLDTARMKVTRGSATTWAYRSFTTIVGQCYTWTVKNDAAASVSMSVRIGLTNGGDELGGNTIASGATGSGSFVATATTIYLRCMVTGVVENETVYVDDVSVKLAVPDRSVANNGAIINGTITRAAVATGAELAAYSGFSASNYLEVPYDSDFDFGTGDFCIMGWVQVSSSATKTIFARMPSDESNAKILLRVTSTGMDFYANATLVSPTTVSTALPLNVPAFFVAMRSGGYISISVNGRLASTPVANSVDLDNASAVVRIGERSALTSNPLDNGSIALLRISATAPTPEQIREIYERERILFQANTKCLAPAINHTSMSYDEEEDLLYATTSGGAYILKGIQVLDKVIDNNLVYSGITATSNITSKWTATGANTYIPSIYPFRSEINKTPRKTYDRNKIKTRTYTTSATPKIIYHIPFDEGEEGTFITRTIGVNRDDGTQIGSYEHKYTARRVNGSANVALIGSTNTVIQEVTSSMDVVVSNGSNYITISYTGLASNTIEWTSYTEGTFNDF